MNLVAKAHTNSTRKIVNQDRWNFIKDMIAKYGDDLAMKHYSAHEDDSDNEGWELVGSSDCTIADAIPASFSRTRMHLSQKT